MSAERLYTPALLAAAVELANWPALETATVHGSARAPTCGSTLAIDLALNPSGQIERIGLRVRACAVGQAAACVFARHAAGHDITDMQAAHDQLAKWLSSAGPAPGWPDLSLIAPAKQYPARHGAMLLPWRAAFEALSSTAPAS